MCTLMHTAVQQQPAVREQVKDARSTTTAAVVFTALSLRRYFSIPV